MHVNVIILIFWPKPFTLTRDINLRLLGIAIRVKINIQLPIIRHISCTRHVVHSIRYDNKGHFMFMHVIEPKKS